MPEIDPVILQLRADVKSYEATLRSTTSKVDNLLGTQEARARQLEREMKRSSTAISGHLRSLASTLATYFTGRELVGLIDGFTRLQNNLRVAGVEGENMKAVQDRLFESAQKYGVSIEELSSLFSGLTQASKDLGATQSDVFTVTDAVSGSLKIMGLSAGQAGDSLLQLRQLFQGQMVQAQEYNSLIDTMYPLLQAVAAGSERWGGSVGKLTADVKASKVSTQEFFRALLQGAGTIETKAAKATLTLSAGFTSLTNALTVYFGEADKTNGVSKALGEALGAVASNLGTLIPAIATIATALGVRYVASTVAATAATVALGAAASGTATQMGAMSAVTFALQARMAGAATTAEAFTFALSGLKGGLVAATILAIGAAIYYVKTKTQDAQQATGVYADRLADANRLADKARELSDKLATAKGKERDAVLKSAQAYLDEARAKQRSLMMDAAIAQSRLVQAEARQREILAGNTGTYTGADVGGNLGAQIVNQNTIRRREADLAAANGAVLANRKAVEQYESLLKAPSSAGAIGGVGDDPKKKKKGRSGPSPEDIYQRFQDERASLMSQYNSTLSSMAKSAEEHAEYEARNVEIARIRTEADIKANKDYSDAQKKVLLAQLDQVAEAERDRIDFEKRRQLEQEAQDLADEEFRAKSDALRVEYDLADTQSDRQRIALQILDAEQEHLRATLEAVIASRTAAEADKRRAQVALDALNAISAGERASVARQNETARERYLRELNKSPEQINEALDDIKISGLNALNDGLADAIFNVNDLGKTFTNVANQIISDLLRIAVQRSIIGPLANMLFGGGVNLGAAASGANSVINAGIAGFKIPGYASGTNFAPGGLALVGENGPELVNLRRGSQVIPNHMLNAGVRAAPSTTVVQQFSFDVRGAVMTQDLLNQMNTMVQKGSLVSVQVASNDAQGKMLARGRRRIPG